MSYYYSVPNILKFNDPLSVGVTFVKIYLHLYYLVTVFPVLSVISQYNTTAFGIILILTGSVWRAFGAMSAMKSIVTADRVEHLSLTNSDALVDPSRPLSGCNDDPWLRCNYIVYLGDIINQTVTIQEIWNCEEAGCILSSSSSSDDLKSYCLSLSLFRKLRSKFTGCIPYQSSHQDEAWNMVRNGLLLSSSSSSSRCPFRVIEVELAFLYDYLYNTSCFFLYRFGFLVTLMRHSCSLIGISLVAAVALKEYHPKEEAARIQYHKHDMDVLLTWIVIVASIALELVQLSVFLSSRWSKTMLLCTYLSQKSWKREDPCDGCIKNVTEIILRPTRGGGELFKPWQRQLGQYSLLESYSYIRRHFLVRFSIFILNLVTGNRFVRACRKQSESAPLTNEIKKAVIQALLDRGPQLTNGIATLQASDELPPETERKLAWACTQLATDAQVVLIWHIATSLCEINWKKLPPGARDDDYCIDDFNVATSLSKYCAYLVAFAPNMLPAHVASTDFTCTRAIDEAYYGLRSFNQEHDMYQKLMEITVKDGVDIEYDDPNSQRFHQHSPTRCSSRKGTFYIALLICMMVLLC